MALIYYKGEGFIEKNLEKSMELLEKVANMGDIDTIGFLAYIYKEEKPPNYEKSAYYAFAALNLCLEKDKEKYKNTLHQNLNTLKVEWRTEYHSFFDFGDVNINKKIICLYLCSKHRGTNNKFMVRGITIKIIKYLCHVEQKIPNLVSPTKPKKN